MMTQATPTAIDQAAQDQLFVKARTHSVWQEKSVSNELIQQIYDLVKLGPTSANSCPARFVFVKSPAAKARLLPCMSDGNIDKTKTAPLNVLVAHDMEFYEKCPQLLPHMDARALFAGNQSLIEESAFRNGSLQGGYLIMAARALGLDCGPMSGFDAGKVNGEFFPDGKWKINFICNLGYGDATALHPRSPRLSFAEACLVY